MICVPTVADRLVQRTIAAYLVEEEKLPIYNDVSFGFIRGRGLQDAIARAIELRETHEWVLKTDIQSFFDSIPRWYLKDRVHKILGRHSVVPFIWSVIEREIKVAPWEASRIAACGVKKGQGIRQGMPLSPVLANLVLSRFDRQLIKAGLQAVRYADDLILFFKSKSESDSALPFVSNLLAEVGLEVPAMAPGSKTTQVPPRQPVEFLGQEIFHSEAAGAYVARVGKGQIAKIESRLKTEFSYHSYLARKKLFQNLVTDLSHSLSSYLGLYQRAYNFIHFENEIRRIGREVQNAVYCDVFGQDLVSSLGQDERRFLGILDKIDLEPTDDFNW